MSNQDKPNSADGQTSYDSTSTGELIQFFNRSITPYPTEVGGPAFDLVPVEKQKDIIKMFQNQMILHLLNLIKLYFSFSIKHYMVL